MTSFNFLAWQDSMDVGSNPVENKLRRDWLSKVLVTQLEGYESKEDVDEWEFLDHYADALFLECWGLTKYNSIALKINGCFSIHCDAGWRVSEKEFGNLFNDENTALAFNFSVWLESLEGGGESLKCQLLDIYCNHGDAALRGFQIKFEDESRTESPDVDSLISGPGGPKKTRP